MTLRKYLISMSFLSLLLWAVFVFIASVIDPNITNWFGFFLFYLSLFFALSSALTILGFVFRMIFSKKSLLFNSVRSSFRQSFLLSFLFVAILLMLAENIFSWLNIVIVVLILSIVEYIFISEK